MLIGELAKRTKAKTPTLDRYVRLGLLPCIEGENHYRQFEEECVERVELIRALTNRPFKRSLNDIKRIFDNAPLEQLSAKRKVSSRALLRFLMDRELF